MTPNEKRVFEAMEEILIGGPTERELAVVMKLLDAAERRGEDRERRRSIKAIRDRAKKIRARAEREPQRAERLRDIAEWIDGDVDTIKHAARRARGGKRS